MTRRMLIDASHPEETRVVVIDGNRLEEFDYETASRKQLKGNIYLAKVTRVEPSLQAAFVEYGGNRHGFLAFNEIHPDYYRIPVADREKLIAEEAAIEESEETEDGENVEVVGGDELEELERRRLKLQRRYKIQEVIKRRQIILVQVVKEERGNKGAALTTYLSLPGRYCVLMPNTARGGGISRKITNPRDRKRLKSIIEGLGIPEGMAVILRTAGSERSKAEIKRDFDYLLRLWDEIRELTLRSTAPALIYEEANLIKRAIRDLYDKNIEEILVEGEEGYRVAKEFMKSLIPSHAKRVKRYEGDGLPLMQRYQVEGQLDAIHGPTVQLKSGGYIVIHQTEALVAIDVNSGRSTRERHIEETALKTNLEAADEIARQLRLRDLAGLIVIDFIDMEEARNNHAVERRFKEALRTDRARIQIGRISPFGLLEMSRQRLRPSLLEISGDTCPTCGGTGYIRSTDWTALHVLRAIEEEGLRKRAREIKVVVPDAVALYILNQKRQALAEVEARHDLNVVIDVDRELVPPNHRIEVLIPREDAGESEEGNAADEAAPETADAKETEGGRRKRRARRRRRSRRNGESTSEVAEAVEREGQDGQLLADEAPAEPETQAEEEGDTGDEESGEEPTRRRRRRGRRGGRRRSRKTSEDGAEPEIAASTPSEPDEARPDSREEDTGAAATGTQHEEVAEAPAEPEPQFDAGSSPDPDAKEELEPGGDGIPDTGSAAQTTGEMAEPSANQPARRRRRPATKRAEAEAEADDDRPARRTRRSRSKATREERPSTEPGEPPATDAAESGSDDASIESAAVSGGSRTESESENGIEGEAKTGTGTEKQTPPRRGWWQRAAQ